MGATRENTDAAGAARNDQSVPAVSVPDKPEVGRLHKSVVELARITGKQGVLLVDLQRMVKLQEKQIAALEGEAVELRKLREKYEPLIRKFTVGGLLLK